MPEVEVVILELNLFLIGVESLSIRNLLNIDTCRDLNVVMVKWRGNQKEDFYYITKLYDVDNNTW